MNADSVELRRDACGNCHLYRVICTAGCLVWQTCIKGSSVLIIVYKASMNADSVELRRDACLLSLPLEPYKAWQVSCHFLYAA